jgi:hypothetical protein
MYDRAPGLKIEARLKLLPPSDLMGEAKAGSNDGNQKG